MKRFKWKSTLPELQFCWINSCHCVVCTTAPTERSEPESWPPPLVWRRGRPPVTSGGRWHAGRPWRRRLCLWWAATTCYHCCFLCALQAFYLTTYTDARTLELLLATIFQPHNSYCLHVDAKVSAILQSNISTYDGVWVLPYIPVHQQAKSHLIDYFTEITKEHF